MGGGLMQLVAYGAQDIYLTGQPQITFFKSVYRRHTNFAIESIQQQIEGTLEHGNRLAVSISRVGDLVSGMYLQAHTNTGMQDELSIGTSSYDSFLLLESAEIEIGGQTIDTIYSDWMVAYSELVYRKASPVYATAGVYTCQDPLALSMQAPCNSQGGVPPQSLPNGKKLFIPLLFWFNKSPGLSIPLIALQYQELKLIITLANSVIFNSLKTRFQLQSHEIWVDFVYLDSTERKKFAENAHEYLISQHQQYTNTIQATECSFSLNFNHPCKYLMWWSTGNANVTGLPSPITVDGMIGSNWKITLSGHDRFAYRPSEYFQSFQVYNHWPTSDYGWSYAGNAITPTGSGVYGTEIQGNCVPVSSLPMVYSFALRPAEHQPSGTLNFSRIDDAKLIGTNLPPGRVSPGSEKRTIKVYAENYNILRIMSGMGGLAYSN